MILRSPPPKRTVSEPESGRSSGEASVPAKPPRMRTEDETDAVSSSAYVPAATQISGTQFAKSARAKADFKSGSAVAQESPSLPAAPLFETNRRGLPTEIVQSLEA